MDKVPNQALLNAGLEIMAQNGRPLRRLPAPGRAMIYEAPGHETVRIRTCNDHALIVLAGSADVDARMNIEGTDLLLIIMPEIERTPGPVTAFLVPTQIAVDAAKTGYRGWLARNPNTKGNNKTRNLWFDSDSDAPGHGFMASWNQYRLGTSGVRTEKTTMEYEDNHATIPSTMPLAGKPAELRDEPPIERRGSKQNPVTEKLGHVISRARQEIADAAGVSPTNVHIRIDIS